MTRQTIEERYGRLDIDDGRAVVRYTRQLPHSQARVWQALTEDKHLAGWFPTTVEGERAPGAALTFRFTDVDVPPMSGRMCTFDPPSLLEFSWGDDVIRFELKPDGDAQSVLTLVVTMAEFGKAARDGAGWHISLDHLAADLNGDRDGTDHGDRWRELNQAYVEQFGPKASTIGPPKEWQDTYGDAN